MLTYADVTNADVHMVQAIVHAADLSGQTLEKDIAYSFGRGVLREFHTQVLNSLALLVQKYKY
jgi:hypothetical protein